MSTPEPDPTVSGTGPRAAPVDPWRLGLVERRAGAARCWASPCSWRAPTLDMAWQHQPAHFWIVLAAGAVNAVLAYATGLGGAPTR